MALVVPTFGGNVQSIKQMSQEAAGREALQAFPIPERLQIVIPAKNAARTIEGTLAYLKSIGVQSNRIHVVVNGTTDGTDEVARATGLAQVHKLDDLFETHATIIQALEAWGVPRSRLHGKGTAMFASLFVLKDLGLSDTDPVLFLDAELTNLHRVDPVRRMLLGWETFNAERGEVQIVKLASSERIDNWYHPFLAANPRYGALASMRWPLCGQAVVSWGTLRQMRFATMYGIEMAMLMSIADRHTIPNALGEVQTNGSIADDYVHTPKNENARFQMLFQIQMFVQACTAHGLMNLDRIQIRTFNSQKEAAYWSTGDTFSGPPNEPLNVPLDAILPSLDELLASLSH